MIVGSRSRRKQKFPKSKGGVFNKREFSWFYILQKKNNNRGKPKYSKSHYIPISNYMNAGCLLVWFYFCCCWCYHKFIIFILFFHLCVHSQPINNKLLGISCIHLISTVLLLLSLITLHPLALPFFCWSSCNITVHVYDTLAATIYKCVGWNWSTNNNNTQTVNYQQKN